MVRAKHGDIEVISWKKKYICENNDKIADIKNFGGGKQAVFLIYLDALMNE